MNPGKVGHMPEPRKQRRPPVTDRLMKQAAAARALDMARSTVLGKVAIGELEAEMVDGTPMIVRASVEAYLARQREFTPATAAA